MIENHKFGLVSCLFSCYHLPRGTVAIQRQFASWCSSLAATDDAPAHAVDISLQGCRRRGINRIIFRFVVDASR
jgi:hypothetical protein